MNKTRNITLSTIPEDAENIPVTKHRDGTVISRVFDLVWRFPEERISVAKAPTVRFGHVDAAYRRDIQSTLLAIMKMYKARNRLNATYLQVDRWKYGLVQIREGLGSSNWASLSDDKKYKRFKVKVKQRVQKLDLGTQAINIMLSTMNKLVESDLSARIPVRGEFLNFSTKEVKQHIAIPIGIYQPIIVKALETVEMYHPHRFAINKIQAHVEEIYLLERSRTDASPEIKCADNRALARVKTLQHSIPRYKLTKNGASLNRILVACSIVTLAFSGVRAGEMLSMNKHSYEEKGANTIPTLRGEETKRLGNVVSETWQTHQVVRDALELAYDATQFLRDIYEGRNNEALKNGKIDHEEHKRYLRQIASAFLNVNHEKVSASYCHTNLARQFNLFIKSAGILATQVDVDEFDRLTPSREGQLKVGGGSS